MDSSPSTQKAWIVKRRGHPRDALALETIPIPALEPGFVLVKVEAAALNPAGHKMMELIPNFLVQRPHVAEFDFTGTIADRNGTHFNNGDKVFGMIWSEKKRQGSLAEYAMVKVEAVALRPDNLSLEQAAGLALVGQTVWQALFDVAKVETGQSVFVNGGSSSVGLVAIQLLKAKNCIVGTSCSLKNFDLVKRLGADRVFDYKAKPLEEQLSDNPPSPKYHVFLDAVGGNNVLYTHSEAFLAPKGVYIYLGGGLRSVSDIFQEIVGAFKGFILPTWLGGTNRAYKFVSVKSSQGSLQHLCEYVNQGKLTPPVDSVFAFKDALEAYDRILSGRATGKVVVTIP